MLASVLLGVGVLSLAGWVFQFAVLVQPLALLAPTTVNGSLSLLVFGLVLLGRELGWYRAAWLTFIPITSNCLVLLPNATGSTYQLDGLLPADFLQISASATGHTSPVTAFCLLLTGLGLLLPAVRVPLRLYALIQGVTGSLICSMGFIAVINYVVADDALYDWSGRYAISPVMAASLCLLGGSLLLYPWNRIMKVDGAAPRWAPIPVVIVFTTLSVAFWLGLRERERSYLAVRTQSAMETLALQINAELDRQSAAFERRAHAWSAKPPTHAVWETDVHTQWLESSSFGAKSFAWVKPDGRNRWVYPTTGNEDMVAFDHAADPVRASAMAAAKDENKPVISGSVIVAGQAPGFVIYTPIINNDELTDYAAAEFLYHRFFETLAASRLKLDESYHIGISIGGETIYSSSHQGATAQPNQIVEKSFTIHNRRLRLSLAPTSSAVALDHHNLPEYVLIADIGISLLLGLSVHLARRARADHRAALQSNANLRTENEERRQVETRLKLADERLHLALESTQIGIFEFQVATRQINYSPSIWKMLGYDPASMSGTLEAWSELLHPDDLPLFLAKLKSQQSGAVAFIEAEYRILHRDGVCRWVSMRAKTVGTGQDGSTTRIIGTIQDVTTRHDAEQALRTSQAETRKLSLVAAKTGNPVVICLPDGRIEWVNESFIRVMGYTLDGATGNNAIDLLAGAETDTATVGLIRTALEQGQPAALDFPSQAKDGRKYHLHLELQPVRSESGVLTNHIIIATDITARVEIEQQLRRAKSEADSASNAKSAFLATMSHEIRTPMNGVIGMTSLLADTTLTPEQRGYVTTIRTSGEALLGIINDILDFSKIESGKMELDHTPFDLSLCIEDVLDLFSLQAASRKLELTYYVHPDVPAWIVSDAARLRQVLVNLVSNAVKFTTSGSVSIEARRIPFSPTARAGTLQVEFAVRDTGIGIPEDRLDRLFQAFSQVDSSTTRKFGGTGLGLVISQRLAALLGGDIWAQSTLGEGSAFFFTILTEAAALHQEDPTPAIPAALRNSLIVIVEDHPITQARLRAQFESWKLRFEIVPTPAAALKFTASLSRPPTLLLIDADENDGKPPFDPLPTIQVPRFLMVPFGLTSSGFPVEALTLGTISKPIKTQALLYALTQVSGSANLSEQNTTAASPSLLSVEIPLSLLLVEDNAVNQRVAQRFLERLGYVAEVAVNGLEAVAAVKSGKYDLVFMDLQMPVMDGIEACRQIRRELTPEQQPVIIALTANAIHGDRERCLDAGMNDYISKPFKMNELISAIRRQFTGTKARPVKSS